MDKSHYYDLAYAFRKAKPWKKIDENELFAVRVPSAAGGAETIGYCCLMGRDGEHMALAVYPGAEGFSSYRRLAGNAFAFLMESSPITPELFQQDCIQCSMEQQDQFTPEDLDEVRAYCKASHAPFRKPYPQFSRYRPWCMPWAVTEPDDWNAIETALLVVDKLGEALKKTSKVALGLHPILVGLHDDTYAPMQIGLFDEPIDDGDAVTIPLFSIVDGELKSEQIPLPPYTETVFAPPRVDELSVARLKKGKQKGVFQCEVVRSPMPVDGEPPYLPALLMTVDREGLLRSPVMGEGVDYDPTAMLNEFIGYLDGERPRTIKVRTEETRILLEEFCKKAGIRLQVTDKLDLLDEAMENLQSSIFPDLDEDDDDDFEDVDAEDADIEEVLAMLESLSVEELRQIPGFVMNQLLELSEFLSPNLVKKIRQAGKKR